MEVLWVVARRVLLLLLLVLMLAVVGVWRRYACRLHPARLVAVCGSALLLLLLLLLSFLLAIQLLLLLLHPLKLQPDVSWQATAAGHKAPCRLRLLLLAPRALQGLSRSSRRGGSRGGSRGGAV